MFPPEDATEEEPYPFKDIIVSDRAFPNIRLVPFSSLRSDEDIKSTYLSWLNDGEVVRSIASPALLNLKGEEFVEESFLRFTKPDSRGFFVYFIPEKTFIGTAKLDGISSHCRSAWDGIMIGDRRYHGRGFSAPIYRILLSFGFKKLGLNRVSGGCNENNLPMLKTFARLGYRLEGRLRQADFIEGQFSDHLYFGILRNEFLGHHDVDLELGLDYRDVAS